MKKSALKFTSIVLTLALVLSTLCIFVGAEEPAAVDTMQQVAEEEVSSAVLPYLTDKNLDPDEVSNAVVIPGVFQSRVCLYDENDNLISDEGPFFLSPVGDIVKLALKKALLPLLSTLILQYDIGGKLADAVAEVLGYVLGEKVKSDANGKLVYNLKADYYDGSVAELKAAGRDEDVEYIYDQIPLQDYAAAVGEDHLYFYSYCSFGNLDEIVDKLYELIQKAAAASPTGKANIVPISQGGTLAVNLLERHPEVGEILDRIVYIVPALDGTVLLGDIFDKGLIDDDVALYREMLPLLINDDDTPWLGNLITIILRILPNKTVNEILDKAVDTLIGEYLGNSTCMWAFVCVDNYDNAASKYLTSPDKAVIKAQTDAHHQGMIDRYDNIMKMINDYDVEVFDIVDYNYTLYPICDSWNSVNGDGIIQVDSTSMGATSFGVDVQLPSDYVPAKGAKYVDKYNIIDAGTGLLPDQTFYFHGQDHERTARNDVIMKLAICLLTDSNFTSVDSYPEQFPQFNEARNSRDIEWIIEAAEKFDTSSLSAEDAAAFEAALEEAKKQLNDTKADPEEFNAANDNLRALYNKARGVSTDPTTKDKMKDGFNNGFSVVVEKISEFLFKTIGGKGFGDVIHGLFFIF